MDRFTANMFVHIGKITLKHFSVIWNELLTGKADLTIRDGKFTLSRHSKASHMKLETSLSDIRQIISYLRDAK